MSRELLKQKTEQLNSLKEEYENLMNENGLVASVDNQGRPLEVIIHPNMPKRKSEIITLEEEIQVLKKDLV